MDEPTEKIEDGRTWYMQACGHYQSAKNSKFGLCPNCQFMAGNVGLSIPIKYPELLPKEVV